MPPAPPPARSGFAALGALVDLLARRHALTLVWSLRGAPAPFRTLLQETGAAEPVVSQRLRELRDAGLVEVSENGEFRLSSTGRRLQGALDPLDGFATAWAELSPRTRVPRGSADRAYDQP